jgi:hypothetical protein
LVHDDAFAPEQDVKPAIAKSSANGCEFTQPHSRRPIVRAVALKIHLPRQEGNMNECHGLDDKGQA